MASRTATSSARPNPTPPRPGRARDGWFNRPLLGTMDRYVLASFLKNYAISLFVLIGLYVVLDMVFNFDEFVKVSGSAGGTDEVTVWQTIRSIAAYYFFQAFRIFSYLAGVIPVVATAFTLMRMSRFNELTALLGAGIQLFRVAAPIIFASLVLNCVLLLVNQELIVPSLIDKLTRDRGDTASKLENSALLQMPDGDNGNLFAGRYTPPVEGAPAKMEVVVLFRKEEGRTVQIAADAATFDPATQSWSLVNGTRTRIASSGGSHGQAERIETFQSTVNPETIALFISRGDFVDLLSSKRIEQLLAQKTSVGRIDLMRVRDARWANYVLNVVLVLLTIPCVLTREPTDLRTAAGRTFLLIGACMATIFICQNIAGQPPANPALASKWPAIWAVVPIFIFLPIAIWLLDRLKT